MKRSFRFVIYLAIGFLIHEIIESEKTGLSHVEVRNTLIISLVVVFVLLMIVRVIKQRYDDGENRNSQ